VSRRLALLTAVAIAAGAGPLAAEDPGDAGRGHSFAMKVCSECHGIEATDEISPNLSATPFRIVANTPGMSPRALTVWLTNPHPTMPSLVLERDDMHDVIAYILSLKARQ